MPASMRSIRSELTRPGPVRVSEMLIIALVASLEIVDDRTALTPAS
jgi:hypothetical protein